MVAVSIIRLVCAVISMSILGDFTPASALIIQRSSSAVEPLPEQQEFDRLLREGMQAFNLADYPTAEKAFQSGLDRAQALADERRIGTFLNALGNVYYRRGQFSKALRSYTLA